MTNKEKNEDKSKPCDCPCHKDPDIRHFRACCMHSYAQYPKPPTDPKPIKQRKDELKSP